jgi:cysteine desulfurase
MSAPLVYLDHAATTPVRPEVLDAMLPYLGGEGFGNPSSGHRVGRAARSGMDQARRELAEATGAEPNQVVFTSGGTEADNLAVIGASLAAQRAGRPMIAAVAATEHKAVLAAAHEVVRLGGSERILPVDSCGLLDTTDLEALLRLRPSVVSVMGVNNETGVVQPTAQLAERCRAAGVAYHTDLVQTLGKLPVRFAAQGISFASVSGHKLGAPKGSGALLVREPERLGPILHGGSQQRSLRPGTENVAGAVALARAALLAARDLAAESVRLTALRDRLLAGLRAAIPDLLVPGEAAPRAPHILSLILPGTRSDALLMHLDLAGIAASGGSACATGAVEPSHVLLAMGIPHDLAAGAIRLSLGRESTDADVDRALEVIPVAAGKVRQLTEVLHRG